MEPRGIREWWWTNVVARVITRETVGGKYDEGGFWRGIYYVAEVSPALACGLRFLIIKGYTNIQPSLFLSKWMIIKNTDGYYI